MTARDEFPRVRMLADELGPTSEFAAVLNLIDQLRHWKSEASTVIDWWEDVWRALGEPGELGGFKSKACIAAIDQLRGELAAAIAERDRRRA